jgi:hypothetical protein
MFFSLERKEPKVQDKRIADTQAIRAPPFVIANARLQKGPYFIKKTSPVIFLRI